MRVEKVKKTFKPKPAEKKVQKKRKENGIQ